MVWVSRIGRGKGVLHAPLFERGKQSGQPAERPISAEDCVPDSGYTQMQRSIWYARRTEQGERDGGLVPCETTKEAAGVHGTKSDSWRRWVWGGRQGTFVGTFPDLSMSSSSLSSWVRDFSSRLVQVQCSQIGSRVWPTMWRHAWTCRVGWDRETVLFLSLHSSCSLLRACLSL